MLYKNSNGGFFMRLAVPYDHGTIFGHFGRTARFKLYDLTDGRIVSSAIVDTMGNGHGALAGFLKAYAVDVLICGGIGAGARLALEEAGIKLFPGVSGKADEAVSAWLAGTLVCQPELVCKHHHEDEPRVCGSHTCSAACYHDHTEGAVR